MIPYDFVEMTERGYRFELTFQQPEAKNKDFRNLVSTINFEILNTLTKHGFN
jgi:hypothetical protein